MKLFIGNLPYDVTEAEVLKIFSNFGEVVNTNLIEDHFSGQPKGFAFVDYKNRQLVCNEAQPQKKGKKRR